MGKPIYFIGGSKGGVGKSCVSMALLDYLIIEGEKPFLIEADKTNPDVYKAYESVVTSECLSLDDADGWIDLVDAINGHPDSAVVINTPARNNDGVKLYGETLTSTLKDLERELVVFWVINRQRDSLELLAQFMAAMPDVTIHVVRNLHHGDEQKFELYNASKVKSQLQKERAGTSLSFPALASRVADKLASERMSIDKAIVKMPLGNRAELERWRRVVSTMFSGVIHVTQ
jgi:MinD-like ATPase involved in chromosome partitioning or flagellar assembly